MISSFFRLVLFFLQIAILCTGTSGFCADRSEDKPAPAKWSPAARHSLAGAVPVAVIFVEFQDTAFSQTPYELKNEMEKMGDLSQEEYFKIYSNGIVWPVITIYPNDKDVYKDAHYMGYYCYYDFWSNPIGWKSSEEGGKRVAELKARALAFAKSKTSKMNYKSLNFSYCVDPITDPAKRPNINGFYTHVAQPAGDTGDGDNGAGDDKKRKRTIRKKDKEEDSIDDTKVVHPAALVQDEEPFDAWGHYSPAVRWAEPLWPNSSIQQWGASPGTFAHEFGHVIGAPDVYRIGRANDGIGGVSALLCYGPTSTAFSRYYHHGYLDAKNYPTITTSGSYTLHPRHITPSGNESLGFIIPSRHPHYYYHVEYICGEKPALGANGSVEGMNDHSKGNIYTGEATEGMLISVIRPGLGSYQGSPDMFYTYRENDPYFRGSGNTGKCIFGKKYRKTEFNMKTEPSSRLPNLLDGGVKISNIKEAQGTLTFDVEIDKTPLKGPEYKESLIPQIQLDGVDQILSTSFRMTCQHKFRGEPLIESYGFCWNTSPKPTLSNSVYTLRHGEIFEGRALNLMPGKKYYVRAWASNKMGTRYSDEEIEVTTLKKDADPGAVDPLCLDRHAHNWMIYVTFYGHGPGGKIVDMKKKKRMRSGSQLKELAKSSHFTSFPALVTLGKMMSYFRPEKIMITMGGDGSDKKGREVAMDYGQFHWEPYVSDPGYRTAPTIAFYRSVLKISKELQMHLGDINDTWIKTFPLNARRLLKLKELPVITEITEENMGESFETIKKELLESRPVMILQNPGPESYEMPQWAVIDAINKKGELNIQYPSDCDNKPGYYGKDKILTFGYRAYFITGIRW